MSRVRANTIMDQAGSGAPDFPYGFTANSGTVTGLLTATTYSIDDLYVGSAATITATTEATSTTTGALVVSGGVGIAKSLEVGCNISCAGTIYYDDVTHVDALGLSTFREGINVTAGGVSISGGGLGPAEAALIPYESANVDWVNQGYAGQPLYGIGNTNYFQSLVDYSNTDPYYQYLTRLTA